MVYGFVITMLDQEEPSPWGHPWGQIFIIDKSKKGIEKKDGINYNICHTHPGHEVGYRLRLY